MKILSPAERLKQYPHINEMNHLERHGAFFDRDMNGIIDVSETAAGLRELRVPGILAWPMALAIHAGLAKSMNGSLLKLALPVDKMVKGKHGSDTDIYRADGTFDENRFNELFDKFDVNRSGTLSTAEVVAMRSAMKEKSGGGAASAEWGVLMMFVSDATETDASGKTIKAMTRDRLRAFFQGTLFFTIARAI